MSVSIAIKVSDGLILASDSATSIAVTDDQGNTGIAKVYENADKIAQIGNCPVGVTTWGIGSLQSKTITRLVEEFGDSNLDNNEFTESDLDNFVDFFHELYTDEYGRGKENKPNLGLAIGGIIGSGEPVLNLLNFPEPAERKVLRREGDFGANWFGQIAAISRLHKGYAPQLPKLLAHETDLSQEEIDSILEKLEQTVYWGGMPLQDAIDLAYSLIATSKDFHKYGSGPPTCGGPIDVAIISNGRFEWIKQKELKVRAEV